MLRDELHAVVARRQAKLTELFYATVGVGATEGATGDSHYQQKEQAFLDANDLSK